MTTKKLDPVHPGEILQKEFLEPMELSQNRLALERQQMGSNLQNSNESDQPL